MAGSRSHEPRARPETRKRIPLYLGPKESIARASLDAYERTGNYVADEKHDGFWSVVSVVDGRVASIQSRVGLELDPPGLVGLVLAGGGCGRLIAELTADLVGTERSGTRRLRVFDIVEWNALDLRALTQPKRRAALEMVHASACGHSELVTLAEYSTAGFAAFYDRVVARGGEGIVLKRRDQTYRRAGPDGKIHGYADDLTFSFADEKVLSPLLSRVRAIVKNEGFAEQPQRTRRLSLHGRSAARARLSRRLGARTGDDAERRQRLTRSAEPPPVTPGS